MAEKLHDNWYTFVECIEGEEIATVFRVRDPEGHHVVDAVKYMDSVAATLCETADSGDVGKAARAAYQALEVEVWIGLDPNPPANAQACADEEDEDIAVDLWSPMRLAVVLQRARSLELLLQFHKEYALPALELLTAETQLPPPEETGTTTAPGTRTGAASTTGMAGMADVHQSIEELRLPRVRSSHEDAVSSSSSSQRGTYTNNNSNNNNNNGQESAPRERAGSPLPVPSPEDSATSGPRPPLRSPPENSQDPVAPTPLFHCQVRRELGNAVVLLGHYEAPVPAAHITATAAAAVVGRRSQGRTTSAAHVEELTGTPRTQPLSGPLPPPPTADEEAAAARRNRTINDLEMQVLSDAGEAYCIANVMNALKPVLDGVVQCVTEDLVAKSRPATKEDTGASTPPPPTSGSASSTRFTLDTVRRHCSSFGDLLHRPVLVVEASVLFDACDGDLELLAEVLDAFQGSLTPILRGKRFCHMHGTHYAGTASGSAAPSPALHPINSMSSRGSSNIPTPRNQSLSRHGQSARHADPAAATSPHVGTTAVPSAPSALHMEPFWLSCPPQDAQRLAFYALWVNHCEQLAERPGSARQRRAANALTEYRTTVSSFKRMRESNFVPASVVWSGHMFLIAKLLSRDCTIEDFLDVLGEGGYLPALSASSIPGAFVALLAAGSSAAASVTDAPTLRLLTKKIETLLAEVPNRTSTLRAFLTARPATHAERFEELWLGKTNYTTPKKFKTRVEMLYYAAVEVALVAAESAWQESEAPPPQPGSACTCTLAVSAARLVDPKKRDEARAALQGFVAAWRNFFSNARDRPFHRRSMSRSGVANFSFSGNSDVKLTPRAKPLADPQSVGPTTAPTPPGTPLPQAQPSPTLNASVTKEVIVETESLAEFNDAVRKVCTNLPMRLQHGREPLPAIYAAVYPGGALELGEAAGTGAASGEAGSSRASGAATPAHGEKALPVSSLDNEFAYVQKCFGDEAGSESNDIKLKFYGLYKQATVGDINIPKPWLMDTVGRAKWDAWNKLKGMSLVDAKRMYVNEYKMMRQMRADMGKNAK